MSVTSIELPAKDGWEWREVGGAETSTSEQYATITEFPSYKTRYFIRVKIEPEWARIPEGTLCEVSIQVKDGAQVLERMLWREGKSFTYQRGDGFYMPLDEILSARPLRVLGEDEVAVKRVKGNDMPSPNPIWTDIRVAADTYCMSVETQGIVRAYADALEKAGES